MQKCRNFALFVLWLDRFKVQLNQEPCASFDRSAELVYRKMLLNRGHKLRFNKNGNNWITH